LRPMINGDPEHTIAHTINFAFLGVDSEAAMVATKDLVAISNGSACTSQRYEPSHVLQAMAASDNAARGALRISWSHLTPRVDWQPVVERIAALQQS
jgi:cysteine desulfurase